MTAREKAAARKPRVSSFEFDSETYYVRGMNGAMRVAAMKRIVDGRLDIPAQELFALGYCDEAGTLVFDATSAEDLKEIGELDGAFVQKVASEFMQASGLAASSAKDAEKN